MQLNENIYTIKGKQPTVNKKAVPASKPVEVLKENVPSTQPPIKLTEPLKAPASQPIKAAEVVKENHPKPITKPTEAPASQKIQPVTEPSAAPSKFLNLLNYFKVFNLRYFYYNRIIAYKQTSRSLETSYWFSCQQACTSTNSET